MHRSDLARVRVKRVVRTRLLPRRAATVLHSCRIPKRILGDICRLRPPRPPPQPECSASDASAFASRTSSPSEEDDRPPPRAAFAPGRGCWTRLRLSGISIRPAARFTSPSHSRCCVLHARSERPVNATSSASFSALLMPTDGPPRAQTPPAFCPALWPGPAFRGGRRRPCPLYRARRPPGMSCAAITQPRPDRQLLIGFRAVRVRAIAHGDPALQVQLRRVALVQHELREPLHVVGPGQRQGVVDVPLQRPSGCAASVRGAGEESDGTSSRCVGLSPAAAAPSILPSLVLYGGTT